MGDPILAPAPPPIKHSQCWTFNEEQLKHCLMETNSTHLYEVVWDFLHSEQAKKLRVHGAKE